MFRSTVAPRTVLASTSSSRTVVENNTISLNCQVTSNPMPTFIWYKNEIEINRSTYISMSSHSSRIMLHNVSTADAGNYTCFSQNILGNTTANPIIITIYSKFVNMYAVKLTNYTESNNFLIISCFNIFHLYKGSAYFSICLLTI